MRPIASVGPTAIFRDTVIDRMNVHGVLERLPVYVAYDFRPAAGLTYEMNASTAGGTALTADAQATALQSPSFAIDDVTTLKFGSSAPVALRVNFASSRGAFAIHFFIDYYGNDGSVWKLGREEVAERSYTDATGRQVLVFPDLNPVNPGKIVFDTTEYSGARTRAGEKFNGNVVFVEAVFVLTQVDETLYSYYYLNNGLVDQSTVRVDVPEFTNVKDGLGVFGSSYTVTQMYSLIEESFPTTGRGASFPRESFRRLAAERSKCLKADVLPQTLPCVVPRKELR